ncbi:39S ribosomal protein L47, mitochondrial-like [Varroa destructor]|uniref:Large ribosomal subunit protein uL29m n=1 Tax=Varroa destructor TaxID=109461 RepID=A0A7M7K154_VARDE|nr:39S ribosomal protein L47, mitochondrial-like [Varroa destructor]
MPLFIQQFGAFRRCARIFAEVRFFNSHTVSSPSKTSKDVENKKEEFTNVDGLKEFFDSPENFGAFEVKHGRSWNLHELRIKSNSDLHKLWYVLLKERNLLLTLEAAAKNEIEIMPSPERLDKVEESMTNLESVVRERNKAYFDLEVGESGERPVQNKLDWMGIVKKTRLSEHWMPQRYNSSYNRKYPLPFNDKNQNWFLQRYRELEMKRKERLDQANRRRVRRQFELFPDVDVTELKRRFPDIDVEKIQKEVQGKLLFP